MNLLSLRWRCTAALSAPVPLPWIIVNSLSPDISIESIKDHKIEKAIVTLKTVDDEEKEEDEKE